ncbi:collapsin response mediator protein 1A [Microtus ochrogaster]|uniref:Collapsin response mediator protein 1A n=1 Tax=Microtus ochrogaster TaxID=79684 RepID=A0A8J6GR96_MICOH|nr:collapsin response mediator protein 1A [Microtus ochrogaster]
MAERRRAWNTEDDLPVYLARPGSAAQTPRQKYGGMFAAVEGAYENKTIDFDAYSVGRRGSARTPRSTGRPDAVGLPCPGGSEDTASDVSEPSGSAVSSPGDRDDRPPALRIRCPAPRDLPLGRDNGQVPSGRVGRTWGAGPLETQGLGSAKASARARCHQGLGDCNGPSPILFYKRFREVVR